MAPPTAPTAPRKMAGTRATRVVPQVVIRTPPPPKPAPIDFYALLKRAVKWDSNNAIVAVLQSLLALEDVSFGKSANFQ
ncbi:hypothetical protein C0993_002510 [Termitomyces sp. T159_Od127]|nr:hypothetical protein C0993_002510 [Termitomyces sp. T159_Od127]